ncbi:MAG: hypothetical protein IPN13_12375 [Bacteroidetes bacterium]|nr:hypothetical protein [Bacteroidota bacterium]
MSKYLPFENIIYKTKFSKEQAIQKLIDNIEAERTFGFSAPSYTYSKQYIGQITGNKFKIKRVINYRNSFLPQIKGEVYSEFDGTKIKVNMSLHKFVLVFTSIWFASFCRMLNCNICTFYKGFCTFHFNSIRTVGICVALLFNAFKTEKKSRKDLMRIFEV